MKNLAYLFLVLVSCTFSFNSYAGNAEEYVSSYAKLLEKYVHVKQKQSIETSLVDYRLWSTDPLHEDSMNKILKVNPDVFSGKEKMAFWINAYNLLTIDLIIKTGEKQSIKNQGSFFKNVWKSHNWNIGGKEYTLDEIEHEILRPMGEPKIHMAINCASLSCPDLRNEPYIAEKLNNQLDEQTKLFLNNNDKGVRFASGGMQLSKIFRWFSDDFGGDEGVVGFISRNYKGDIINSEIDEYIDYNWSLNSK